MPSFAFGRADRFGEPALWALLPACAAQLPGTIGAGGTPAERAGLEAPRACARVLTTENTNLTLMA